VPATCPYPEPTPSSPHDLLQLPEDPSSYYPPIYVLVSPMASPSGFPTNTLCTPLSSTIRATCLAHLIRLDFITRTILGKAYRSFSSSLCSFLYSPVTSPLLGPNTFINTLFSDTLSLRSSLNVSDQNKQLMLNKIPEACKVKGCYHRKRICIFLFYGER
jgi:hypothetical protein